MKMILTAACLISLAVGAGAFDLQRFSALDIPAASADGAVPALPAPEQVKAAGHYEQVAGDVHLSAQGVVPDGMNGGYVVLTLTGTAAFRDPSGEIKSNKEYINVKTSMWLKLNQPVNHTVSVNIPVIFYRDGEYLGSAALAGTLQVLGTVDSKIVTIFAQGVLSGPLYLVD